MNHDAVPEALKKIDAWVTWRYEKEGKPVSKDTEGATKIPYNPRTGHKASSTNPNTWTSYATAAQAAAARKHNGTGFVFSEDDPFTGIDLDHCIDPDGSLQAWAMDIVTTMDSYTEISPSGSGVKIWVEGEIPSSIKTPQIEMYFKARYFTVTGHHLASTPTTIRNVNGALSTLYDSVKKETPTLPSLPTAHATIGDEHAVAWARRKLADAIRMVVQAPDGMKDDTLIDAGRLAGGAVPHVSESEIETALYAAIEGRAADKSHAIKTIRNGIRMGLHAPLPVPPPPPQPVFDADQYAYCPVHNARLDPAKNGNGYKCRQRDATTANGWCDFWWKGEGYIAPRSATIEPVIVAGELISQPPIATALTAPRYVLYKLSGLRALPPLTWLVKGEIPASLTTIICGPSGAGKSFLMIDYVMRVARANPERIVVYIAPEGGSGYHLRTQAWLNHFGGDEPENLLFILQAIPMLDPKAVHELITIIRPFNPVMLVIDTLARCLVGGDENSAKDVGMFFYHTDAIRQETDAAIAIVHHTGKAGNFRGSSALYGSVESWIDVANDDGLITVSCGKSKDAEPFPPRYLRMIPSADSVVLLPSDQVDQRNAPLSEGQRTILETLSLGIFRDAGAKRSEIVSASGINDRTIFRILSRMKQDRLINQSKKGDPYFISDEGLEAIKSYHRILRQKRNAEQLAEPVITPPAPVVTITLPRVNDDDVAWLCNATNSADSTGDHCGIYEIQNTQTGQRYIGMTRKSFTARWIEHARNLRMGRGISRQLNDDWASYGESAFQFRSVEILSEDADYGERELYWIAVAQHCGQIYNLNGATQLATQTPDYSRQVANSQSSSNQVAIIVPDQLASSTNLHPFRGGASSLRDQDATSESPNLGSGWRETDLFPEDAQASETKNHMELDWGYLRARYKAKDMAAISTHCAMRQIDPETVLLKLESGVFDVDS